MARLDKSGVAEAAGNTEALLRVIASRLGDQDRLDATNSTFTPLGSGATFTGEWQPSEGLGVLSFFAFTDQPFAELRLEWSDDGVNPASGLLGTADYLPSEELTSGFYVYYPDPQTYLLRDYYRVVAVNDTAAQTTLEAYLWTFPVGSNPFTFVDPNANLSTLSKSLLTRSIDPATVVSHFTDADHGTIPSGASVTIDPVLNTEPNVLDSGWIDTSLYSGKSIINALTDQPVKVFLMNASSDQGANIFGNLAPTLVTNALFPAQLSALYADDWFRIVVCNDSGSDLTDYSIRAVAAPESTDGVTTAIDQPVFGFFPAKINRSVQVGRQPDGDYINAPATGAAHDIDGVIVESTTPLGTAGSYQSGWVDTDGWDEIEVIVATDQVSGSDGILLEFTDDSQATTPTVRASQSFTFAAEDVAQGSKIIRLAPVKDGVRLTYTNGGTAQGAFYIGMTLRADATALPRGPITSPLDASTSAVTTRGALVAPSTVDGVFAGIKRSPGLDNVEQGLHVYTVGGEPTRLRALTSWTARSGTAVGTATEVTGSSPLPGRKTITLKANANNNKDIFVGPNAAVGTSNVRLVAGEGLTLDLDETAEVWVITDGTTQAYSVVEVAG